jgi:hypothetical protein
MEMLSSIDLRSIEEDRNGRFAIRRVGIDRKIYIFLAVEMCRFAFYFWFLLIITVSVTLTAGLVEVEYMKIMRSIDGYVDFCAYFQSSPALYALPTLYAVYLVISVLFIATSLFTAWGMKQENKISGLSFTLYTCAFIYLFQSLLCFNSIFVVQHDTKSPVAFIVHRLPFTNLVIGIFLMQMATTWLNCTELCNTTSDNTILMSIVSYVSMIILLISSFVEIIHQINSFGGLGNDEELKRKGLLWNLTNERIGLVCQVNEAIWVLFAFVIPLFESGYLIWKKFPLHGIIITVQDNIITKSQYRPVPGNFWDGNNYSDTSKNDTSDQTF